MHDSHLHSIIKSVSWRIFGTLSTMIITYIFTRKLDIAMYVGMFEFASKIILFYLHERLWILVSFRFSKMSLRKLFILKTLNEAEEI